MLRQFLPRLLPALSPFYDPRRKRPPAGMDDYMSDIEMRYGMAPD
jgi:hypothetical protein